MTNPSDPPVTDDRVMTRNEVASWLAISLPTLMARVEAGDVPASRIGKEWRFWRPALAHRLFALEAPVESTRHDAEIITTTQLAERLQLTSETVRARIDDGSIPASKIGNTYRIYWPAIRAKLESGEDFTPREPAL